MPCDSPDGEVERQTHNKGFADATAAERLEMNIMKKPMTKWPNYRIILELRTWKTVETYLARILTQT